MRKFIYLVLCCLTLVLPISLSILAFGLLFQAFKFGNFGLVIVAVLVACAVPFSCHVIIDVMFEDIRKDTNRK